MKQQEFDRFFIEKAIYQYTTEGVFVKEYKSILQASRMTGINRGNISQCSVESWRSAGGYFWILKTDKI